MIRPVTGPVTGPATGPSPELAPGLAVGSEDDPEIERAAAILLGRERDRTRGEPISRSWPCLDLTSAYAVQDQTLRSRMAAGRSVVGVALGTADPVGRGASGAASVTGWLTDAMALPAGAPVPHRTLIAPAAAPEIAFVMGERLAGPGVTPARAASAVSAVCAGVRVIDSRYREPCPTLPDVVADNAGVAGFVTGPLTVPMSALDLSLEACLLEVDGEVVGSATGAAVPGNPVGALAAAVNLLAARGQAVKAGWVVLTGMLTAPVSLSPAVVLTAHFTSLGSIVLPMC